MVGVAVLAECFRRGLSMMVLSTRSIQPPALIPLSLSLSKALPASAVQALRQAQGERNGVMPHVKGGSRARNDPSARHFRSGPLPGSQPRSA